MAAIQTALRAAAVAVSSLLALNACSQSGADRMQWARAALERNGELEIVATDPQTSVFTVRVKESGELRMVRAEDLVASIPTGGVTTQTDEAGQAPVPSVPAGPAEVDAVAAQSIEPAPDEAAEEGYEPPLPAIAESPVPVSESQAATAGPGVLASGPGYSIAVARGTPAASVPATAPASSADSTVAAGVPVERRAEPLICQGRFLHIDNANLEFEGDAVRAEDGCELHITNSRIAAAHGFGVSASGSAVHIKNSRVEGSAGSVEASEGAQVYAQSSSFKGMMRRLDSASLHDLGDNVWN